MPLLHIVLDMERDDGQNCAYVIDEERRILRQLTLEGDGWQEMGVPAYLIGSALVHPEITNYCQPDTFTSDLVEGYKPVVLFESGPRLEAFDILETRFVDDDQEEDDKQED
ncbi:hypothetical protein KY335_05285 [Candidatus Woesearchaeota archaeon]|nr:hypothetical protein [Candidatus Woesearchaeota archaeon]